MSPDRKYPSQYSYCSSDEEILDPLADDDSGVILI